jgi:hypothetical protein
MTPTRRNFSLAICLLISAASLPAAESPCAMNYSNDGKSASTFVLVGLTPEEVVDRLPRRLMKNGVTMQSSDQAKGTITAAGLEIKAEASGDAARVTFRSSAQPPADKDTLCRYASLAGTPPSAPVAQDPALIARLKNDLIAKHKIAQPPPGSALNNATFSSLNDFLDLKITGMKQSTGKQEYEVSMLLPRTACAIVGEDLADAAGGMNGVNPVPRTKPVRIKALLIYEGDGAASHLADASIMTIESMK